MSVGAFVLYLALRNGGYEPVVFGVVGTGLWWLLALGLLFGLLPARRPPRSGLALLTALSALVLLTLLSLLGTVSVERTVFEAVRVLTLLAVAMFVILTPVRPHALVSGLAIAGALVALIALASRLEPGLASPGSDVVEFLPTTVARLSFPLGYWNALAVLMAMTLPLLLALASGTGSRWVRAAAAAAAPMLVLVCFYTLSRGGLAALVAACAALLALHPQRRELLLTVSVVGVASAMLIWAAGRRQQLADGLLTPTAESQGLAMAAITLLVVLLAAAAQWALLAPALRRRLPPLRPSRTIVGSFAAAAVLVAVVAALFAGAPGQVADRWQEFRDPAASPTGASRLTSAAGRGRYQWWEAAVEAGMERPLQGNGAGTYELWWNEHGTLPDPVRDAHSLYLESLAELGLPGFLVVCLLVGGSVLGGALIALRAPRPDRVPLAAMVAACVAFAVSAAVDWSWEMMVLAAVFVILASGLAGYSRLPAQSGTRRPLPLAVRVGGGVAAAGVSAALMLPVGSAALLDASREHGAAERLQSAFDEASRAAALAPWAASPPLQQALVLERAGDLDRAAERAQAAIDRESANWQNWLTLARIEAKRSRFDGAVAAFDEAEQRNPRSPLFDAPVRSLPNAEPGP